MAAVTINTSDVQRAFTCDWVDTVGVEHTGQPVPPGYGNVTWTADDAGLLVQLTVGGATCNVKMVGPTGTFNLTCKASKGGSPDMIGTSAVTIVGPVGSHLNPILLPLGS